MTTHQHHHPVRRLLATVLAIFTLAFTVSFGLFSFAEAAIAEPSTPEAAQYEVDEGYSQLQKPHQEMLEKAENAEQRVEGQEKSYFEKLKERLNLDEILPNNDDAES